MEKCGTGTYYAVEKSLGRWLSRLAYRVCGNGHQIPWIAVRHTWRGMDLQFPHHESEIAQSTICNHKPPVRYWIHNNMITINGRKMGKSYNNQIRLTEMF